MFLSFGVFVWGGEGQGKPKGNHQLWGGGGSAFAINPTSNVNLADHTLERTNPQNLPK